MLMASMAFHSQKDFTTSKVPIKNMQQTRKRKARQTQYLKEVKGHLDLTIDVIFHDCCHLCILSLELEFTILPQPSQQPRITGMDHHVNFTNPLVRTVYLRLPRFPCLPQEYRNMSLVPTQNSLSPFLNLSVGVWWQALNLKSTGKLTQAYPKFKAYPATERVQGQPELPF